MKKTTLLALSFFALTSQASFAGTKTLVEYGTVQQSKIITHTQQGYHPLRTLAAGAVGGVVGHQFGNGNGKTAMTVGGAVAGAAASRHHQTEQLNAQEVDLFIKTQSGQTIEVIQSYNGSVTFNPGDKVRILTTGSNTTVDKSV
ncbi:MULTISPECIES: glycine zipper 2TM domain-containing protein [Enterobacterales]|uniref:glycine zipper 2TM domain-containing protein n=1 Tax=Enterobacterales TaxID=91347 RepID=UPI002ED8828C